MFFVWFRATNVRVIVVDLEGNVGRVAIRYDESKGSSTEKKHS